MNQLSSNTIHAIILRNWWMLKLTYGLLLIVAGADKFFNLVTTWEKYIGPFVKTSVPLSSLQIVYLTGIFEIITGILILTIMTRIGAYIAAIWFLVVALNLLNMIIYMDIAVRDVIIAIGAIVLAQLTVIKEGSTPQTSSSFH